MLDDATFSLLTASRTLNLRIPRVDASGDECSISTREGSIDEIEESASARLRANAARAAASRAAGSAGSDDEDELLDLQEDAPDTYMTIRVQTLPVAASIGGKIWDASLLMASWITSSAVASKWLPPLPKPGERRPLMLELGAGLGIVGLACAIAYPHMRVVLSDYDTYVLANLRESLKLNGPASAPQEGAQRVGVSRVDFRDFEAGNFKARADAVSSDGFIATPEGWEHASEYKDLAGQCDCLVAADVVYEQSHCALAQLCLTLLAPTQRAANNSDEQTTTRPCAIFMLPDSRPRLREFVDALEAARLSLQIERVAPSAQLTRRLRDTHEGWGAGDATFSLYFVTRYGPAHTSHSSDHST